MVQNQKPKGFFDGILKDPKSWLKEHKIAASIFAGWAGIVGFFWATEGKEWGERKTPFSLPSTPEVDEDFRIPPPSTAPLPKKPEEKNPEETKRTDGYPDDPKYLTPEEARAFYDNIHSPTLSSIAYCSPMGSRTHTTLKSGVIFSNPLEMEMFSNSVYGHAERIGNLFYQLSIATRFEVVDLPSPILPQYDGDDLGTYIHNQHKISIFNPFYEGGGPTLLAFKNGATVPFAKIPLGLCERAVLGEELQQFWSAVERDGNLVSQEQILRIRTALSTEISSPGVQTTPSMSAENVKALKISPPTQGHKK